MISAMTAPAARSPVASHCLCKAQPGPVLPFWPAWPLRQSASPRTGCFSALAVECREAGLRTGTEQQQVTPGSYSGVTACMEVLSLDHTGVSVVRWEPLSLSSTDVLLPNGMQVTVWELMSLHYRCRKLHSAITWCCFSSLWGAPYGG